MRIDLKELSRWISQAQAIFGSPLVKDVLIPMLPKLGVTEEQQAQLADRHADYAAWRSDAMARQKRFSGQE